MIPTTATPNPLEGLETMVAWDGITHLVLGAFAGFVLLTIALVVVRAFRARFGHQAVVCPDGGRIAHVRVAHDPASGGPTIVTECSLRPGESPARCHQDCVHDAA
jgi:hypothetical protein